MKNFIKNPVISNLNGESGSKKTKIEILLPKMAGKNDSEMTKKIY
jgi:hypothetical protein